MFDSLSSIRPRASSPSFLLALSRPVPLECTNLMTEDQRKQLETKLWDIANTLRGQMDAAEFRRYILVFRV
jgi:hypothetical protein